MHKIRTEPPGERLVKGCDPRLEKRQRLCRQCEDLHSFPAQLSDPRPVLLLHDTPLGLHGFPCCVLEQSLIFRREPVPSGPVDGQDQRIVRITAPAGRARPA